MGSMLEDIHGWIEDFARGKCIKNFEVVCPATSLSAGDDISKKDLAAYWGGDLVHLTLLGYEKLGERLSELATANKQKKREREDCQQDQQPQRTRLDNPHRQAGISNSDTFATRWDKIDGQESHLNGETGGAHRRFPPLLPG